MAAIQGCGALKALSLHQGGKEARTHMERNVIDKQSTRLNMFYPKLVHLFGGVNHDIIALVRFISICRSKDQLSLKTKRFFPNNSIPGQNASRGRTKTDSSVWASHWSGFASSRERSACALACIIERYEAVPPGRRPRSSILRPWRQRSPFLPAAMFHCHPILNPIGII